MIDGEDIVIPAIGRRLSLAEDEAFQSEVGKESPENNAAVINNAIWQSEVRITENHSRLAVADENASAPPPYAPP